MIVKINTLPKEIFVTIISHLTSNDKLNCIRVCQQWHQIITSTNLYNNLKFNNVEKFHQAFALFDDNEYIGQQVSQITIDDCDLDMYSIFSLPRLFPNVKHLSWTEEQFNSLESKDYDDEISYPPKVVCQQAFKKWSKNLESITDIPVFLHISTSLLDSTTFHKLRKLDISFIHWIFRTDYDSDRIHSTHTLLKSLIKSIKNAPSLESITLGNVAINFGDMEDLHDAAPNLRELKVDEVHLSSKGARNTSITPAYKLESLFLACSIEGYWNRGEYDVAKFQKANSMWLGYIGQKYRNINKFVLLLRNACIEPVQDLNFPEQHLLDALTNMPKITNYSTEAYHLTDRILNTMHNNNIKLKHIQLWLANTHQMKEEFEALQHSSQTENIKTLNIDRSRGAYGIDNVVFGHSLLSLTSKLANLAYLKIMGIYNGEMAVLFDILQNLTVLETLCFHNIGFRTCDGDIAKNKVMNRTRIKSLKLSVFFNDQEVDDDDKMTQVNSAFEFIIGSCPLLEVFELFGNSLRQQTGGVFELCFLEQNQLRTIKISAWNTPLYYTFNHIPSKRGKCWKNYYDQIEDDSIKDGFHIDLTWRGSVELILR